jgi:Spy/CpxP family protein refolding chaperone
MNARTNNGMRTLVFLTLAAMMVLGTGTALAQRPGGGYGAGAGYGAGYGAGGGRGFGDGEFGQGYRFEMLADHLDLSDEQIAAIKGIQDQCQETNMGLRKELMRLRNELQGEMLKDDSSEKVAQDLIGKIGALQTEIQSNRLQNRLEMRKQLTPEQHDKMLMLHGRFQRGEGRLGGGRGMGPCGDGDWNGPGYGKGRRGARGRW